MYQMEKRISCNHKIPIHWSIAYAGNANAHHTIGGGVGAWYITKLYSFTYIDSTWTDHALLTAKLMFQSKVHGKGTWRANPQLLDDVRFKESFKEILTTFMEDPLNSSLSSSNPQELWDQLKRHVKHFIGNYTRRHA
jgi:hypothetical protein